MVLLVPLHEFRLICILLQRVLNLFLDSLQLLADSEVVVKL